MYTCAHGNLKKKRNRKFEWLLFWILSERLKCWSKSDRSRFRAERCLTARQKDLPKDAEAKMIDWNHVKEMKSDRKMHKWKEGNK